MQKGQRVRLTMDMDMNGGPYPRRAGLTGTVMHYGSHWGVEFDDPHGGLSIGANDADGVYRRYIDICEPLEDAPAQEEPTGYMRPCANCGGRGTEDRAGYIVPCMDCGGTGIHEPVIEAVHPRDGIITEIIAERDEQDRRWGVQDHEAFVWLAILTEEVGEVADATLHGNEGYRRELVQVAAVALAAIEAFDRNNQNKESQSVFIS